MGPKRSPVRRKKIWRLTIISTMMVALLAINSLDLLAQSEGTKRILVIYDADAVLGWQAKLHALCLTNLLGHFSTSVTEKEIDQYLPGEMESYEATFYLGSTYQNMLPDAFLKDVLKTSRTICWLGYNLWHLAWSSPQQSDQKFEKKYGFRFLGLDKSSYPEVYYRGFVFSRHINNQDVGLISIVDQNRAKVLATCYRAEPFAEIPYVVRSSNFWYLADIPFTYITMTDRYLVLADLLHDILGIDHPPTHRALVRIEDVHANASPEKLREIADYLKSEGVPFSVAVIPVYQDSKGIYNWKRPQTLRLSKKTELARALRYMVSKGGEIVLHGLSHQWDGQTNPYTGVSAEDYEFYRVSLDAQGRQVFERPVPGDSEEWVSGRIEEALNELKMAGLKPVAWETPHYLASELDNKYFSQKFRLMTHRGLYFVEEPDRTKHFTNQFFPYPIYGDINGQRLAPENLFCYSPKEFMGEPPSTVPIIIRRARLNLAVRDGWASFFFHWYQDIRELKALVRGIKDTGYQFVPLSGI